MTLELVKELFGYSIAACVTFLDEGVHVLLTGGQRSHIGAVSLAQDGRLLASVSYPGHKEQVISDLWAVRLSGQIGQCVTAACGIHYDNAVPEQIQAVLAVCNELLTQVQEEMRETANEI